MVFDLVRVGRSQISKTIARMLLLICPLAMSDPTLVTVAQNSGSLMGTRQVTTDSVDLLWSLDEIVRDAAKLEILKVGPSVVPSLLSLLKDISQNPSKLRCPTGSEKDGSIRRYDDNSSSQNSSEMDITQRLKNDAAELLGRLQAAEAMPILIELMERDLANEPPRGMRPMMRALAEIGPPALEQLIEEIETAPNRVASRDMQLKPGELLWGPRGVAAIQAGAAQVLGEIGNPKALSVLENLLTRDPRMEEIQTDYAREAIDQIKEKARRHSSNRSDGYAGKRLQGAIRRKVGSDALKRSREVTHLCFPEVTHPINS